MPATTKKSDHAQPATTTSLKYLQEAISDIDEARLTMRGDASARRARDGSARVLDHGAPMQLDDFETVDGERVAQRHREERRAVEEAGGGVSEGFEQAEAALIDHASHGDQHGTTRIIHDARYEPEDADTAYGEPDTEVIEDA